VHIGTNMQHNFSKISLRSSPSTFTLFVWIFVAFNQNGITIWGCYDYFVYFYDF